MNRHDMARFFMRVHHVRLTGCWIWTGGRGDQGYSVFQVMSTDGHYRQGLGHIVSYREWVGEIPAGHEVDHLCMNQRCVNPAHLEAVTPAENSRRWQAMVTHCRNGHLKTPETTAKWKAHSKSGVATYCLICRRQQAKERRARAVVQLRSQRRTA